MFLFCKKKIYGVEYDLYFNIGWVFPVCESEENTWILITILITRSS